MKRVSLVILCCVLLSGCILQPVFDTSSWDAYQKSAAAIKAKLGNDDLRRLEIALQYLLLESTPGLGANGQQIGNVAFRQNFADPYLVLARLGPRINGRTATDIIENLSIKLDTEISESEARLQNTETPLGTVEISSPSYYWQRSGYIGQPIIEFSVRNGGKLPISRIYVDLVLTTPNRAIPWVRQQFVQTFKGGLEPREKQQLTLQPRVGGWNDPQLEYLPNAELKVTVINFADMNGQKMIADDIDRLDLKRKVRAELNSSRSS